MLPSFKKNELLPCFSSLPQKLQSTSVEILTEDLPEIVCLTARYIELLIWLLVYLFIFSLNHLFIYSY